MIYVFSLAFGILCHFVYCNVYLSKPRFRNRLPWWLHLMNILQNGPLKLQSFPPAPLQILQRPITLKDHATWRPRRRRSTGKDVRSLVGYHPEGTSHCCQVLPTLVVFNDSFSNTLRTQLTTPSNDRNASYVAEPDWIVFTPESWSPCSSNSPVMWTLWRWRLWSEFC